MNPSNQITKPVHVVAGVVQCDGKFLLARRAPGKHLEGYWEFPGGKLEQGETMGQSLARELAEEFLIQVKVGEHIASRIFHYSDKTIELHAVYATATGQCGPGDSHDEVAWITAEELQKYKIAPADEFIVEHLLSAHPMAP